MSQYIDLSRIASNEAKQAAGEVINRLNADGLNHVQPELVEKLAAAVANLCHAVDGICQHVAPLTEYQTALLDVIMAEPERIGNVLNVPKDAGKSGRVYNQLGQPMPEKTPYRPNGPEPLEQR